MIGIGHPRLDTLELLAAGEGAIAAQAAPRAARHVERCARCCGRVEALRTAAHLASSAPPLPGGFAERVMAALPERPALHGAIVGEVGDVKGILLVDRPHSGPGAASGVEAFPGMTLREGDQLRALGDSLALITLNDGSTLCINRDSEIDFAARDASLCLTRGALFAHMRRQPRPFVMATPAAMLTVLGTEFEAAVTADKKTQLKVTHGAVAMKTSAGQAVVRSWRKVEAGAYTEPRPEPMLRGERAGTWAAPLWRPGRHHRRRGAAIKAVLAIIVIAAIAVAGAKFLEARRSSEPERQTASGMIPQQPAAAPHTQLNFPPLVAELREAMPKQSQPGPDAPIVSIPSPFDGAPAPADSSPVAPANTTGMSAEEVVRAFFAALISKDADAAVSYVVAPGDTIEAEFHDIISRYLQGHTIQDVTSVTVNGNQARVVYQSIQEIRLGEGDQASLSQTMQEQTETLMLEQTPTGLKINMIMSDIFTSGSPARPQPRE